MAKNLNEYWKRTQRITFSLVFFWFVLTFGVIWFTEPLSKIRVPFFGFPLSFYMLAQGCLIIYLGIIFFYTKYMDALERKYGVDEGEFK